MNSDHVNFCGCGGLVTDGKCEHCDDWPAYKREIELFDRGQSLGGYTADLSIATIYPRSTPPRAIAHKKVAGERGGS